MEHSPHLFVSVIIPVYNDTSRLRLCLQALAQQTYPKDKYEIVVIDNGSTDDVKKVTDLFPKVVLTYEGKPGSYAARNKGLEIAKGAVLAFTDSDCIPASDWLEKGVQHFLATPNCGIAAGKIEFFFQQPSQPNAVELYDSVELLQQKEYVRQQWGATANLFTAPVVLDRVGPFNAELKSGGDLEWGKRVAAHGYAVVYSPDSVVSHPARSSFKDIRKKMLRRLGGIYTMAGLNKGDGHTVRSQLSQKIFVKFRPPIRSAIRKSFLNQKVVDYRHKVMIFGVVFILHYLELLELLRLQLGGKPARQ